MFAELVCLEVHLCVKNDKLLLHALTVRAEEVVVLEMLLESIVVPVIVRLSRVSPVAEETALVLVSAVFVELVIVIEALAAECTQGMALETGLIYSAWLIVAPTHVLSNTLIAEQLMLVGKDLLVARAEVTHAFVVCRSRVPMKIRPSQTGKVAVWVRTVVSKQQDRVSHNIFARVPDADIIVGACDVSVTILVKALVYIIGKNDEGC